MIVEYGFEIDPTQARATQIIERFSDMNVADLRSIEKEARDKGDKFLADEARGEINHRNRIIVPFVEDDGGRSNYFKGDTGDCVTRAIAIAGQFDYKKVYDELAYLNRYYGREKVKTARDGVRKTVYRKYFDELGWEWTPLMHIGSGCTTHVRPGELPESGCYVLSLSKHMAAWCDGVLYDNYDSSRDGTRCVYGFWKVS